MTRKKTDEEFKKEILELVGNKYTFLEEYIGANKKISVRHDECGYEWKVRPKHFIYSSSRCPDCFRNRLSKEFKGKTFYKNPAKTTEVFLAEVFNLVGTEYTFCGKYHNARSKMRVKHKTCGIEYEITPTGFLSGSRCVKCHIDNIKQKNTKTNEQFLKEVKELTEDEYTFLESYKKASVNIKVKHNLCGHEYSVQPNSFLSGARCNKCHMESLHDKLRKTNERFIEDVKNVSGDEYRVLGEYANANTKISMRHNTCNKIFEMRPSSFINRGTRCPYCCESKGEREIRSVLNSISIPYESQYKLDDCKNKIPLPFDFAVFGDNDELSGLIEYDGIQHYEPIKHFGGIESFLVTQKHDSIKNEYAEKHNIPLLRIPYWEFKNIEMLLSNFLEVKELQSAEGGEILWQA